METEQSSAIEAALQGLDEAFIRAANLMDLTDATDDESQMELHEARYHCGNCIVRTVLDEVWPAFEVYTSAMRESKDD